jgi:Uncharacterized conserved protein
MRQVIIHPGEDGFWVAECPSLPGCISQGRSKEEAIENIKEAIEAYTAALKEFPKIGSMPYWWRYEQAAGDIGAQVHQSSGEEGILSQTTDGKPYSLETGRSLRPAGRSRPQRAGQGHLESDHPAGWNERGRILGAALIRPTWWPRSRPWS